MMPAEIRRALGVSAALSAVLALAVIAGLGFGSSGGGLSGFRDSLHALFQPESALHDILFKIRLPRVLLAAVAGAALSLGGLVFQALLRNPLAEPYILGISGGSAIGAILGILLGFSRFPGMSLSAFAGGMATLALVLALAGGRSLLGREALLLSGVMVNAFCSAVIMFMISLAQDARLSSILFWLMGDLSTGGLHEAAMLTALSLPCFLLIFRFAHPMNLLLMGRETARSLGVHVTALTLFLLSLTSFLISATVCYCGLVAFVGLVIPHLLRLGLGPDHRVLVPACLLGGGAYLVCCDLLSRTLPRQGEMPVGVITAMIGAPLFIYLLRKSP